MTAPHSSLPITPLLSSLRHALNRHQFVVLEAAPGAGKTTTVPIELYEMRSHDSRQVIVAEPRRIAARLAAGYVARQLNTPLGDLVGYSVRFEERSGPRTRIRYVTEGVLARLLQADPVLPCAHTVVLDEFHERHLMTDQLLSLLYRLSRERHDLRVVVMSATLDSAPIAAFLDDCPRLSCEGRSHPIEIRYQQGLDDRPLNKRVASAVRSALLEQPDGHVLVFLPGAREIRQAQESLTKPGNNFSLHVLHGEMPIDAQAAAIAPSAQRKVILATNVAESSVTIDDVTTVIDSGLARVAGHSSWSGRATLEIAAISRSSAIQRAGRAGRTRAGLVLRLYEQSDYQRRPEREAPEIERLDLTEFVLQLRGLGQTPDKLRWLTLPNPQALRTAHDLLRRLGALDEAHELTDVGRRMLRHPLAPRLARVLVAAEDLGIADDGCLAVSLLSERDIRRYSTTGEWDLPTATSDVEDRIEVFREAAYDRFRPAALRAAQLEPARVKAVHRAYQQLLRQTNTTTRAAIRLIAATNQTPRAPSCEQPNVAPKKRPHPAGGDFSGHSGHWQADRCSSSTGDRSTLLRRALLTGYSDRVALHQPRTRRLILKDGSVAAAAPSSVVREAPLVIALEVEERSDQRGRAARVQWLSAIEPDWLFEAFASEIEAHDELRFDSDKLRVESVSRLSYGSVTLEESRLPAPPSVDASKVLCDAARQRRNVWLRKDADVDALLQRVALLAEYGVGGSWPTYAELSPDDLLIEACQGKTTLAELADVHLRDLVLGRLSREQQRALAEAAPSHVTLPCGRRLEVQYESGKPPWIATRLQDFFGMSDGPRICHGRVPLTLHLLAPNQRAVQVTSDLSGFWERHYPDVRKELRRRYAKHSWPDDGRTATPPPLKRIR